MVYSCVDDAKVYSPRIPAPVGAGIRGNLAGILSARIVLHFASYLAPINKMKIEKKTWPDLFQDVYDGKKNFDVRLADFECEEGDTLVLREWDPKTKGYTGRQIEKTVRYVIKTKDLKFWAPEEVEKYGFQVIGI